MDSVIGLSSGFQVWGLTAGSNEASDAGGLLKPHFCGFEGYHVTQKGKAGIPGVLERRTEYTMAWNKSSLLGTWS